MATVIFKFDKLKQIRNVSIKAGWLNTGDHPGYPPHRQPSGETIAAVAKSNTRQRDFASLFINQVILSGKIINYLKEDISLSILQGYFTGAKSQRILIEGLIGAIRLGNWQPNHPDWFNFKSEHGLNLNPLIASQVMLDSITSRVEPL